MKKTLYDALSVSANASPEFIDLAYRHLQAQLEPLVEAGQVEAKQRLASIKVAHQILSDPARRNEYDQRLNDETPDASPVTDGPKPRAPLRQAGLVVSVLLLVLSIGLYQQYRQAKGALQEQVVAHASERERLQGDIDQLQAALSSAEARVSTVKAHLDQRQSQAFEQDVATVRRTLEQQRQREEQYARQREAEERRQRQQSQDRAVQQEARNVQSEKRYWACMNEALNRMPSDRANAQCARLR